MNAVGLRPDRTMLWESAVVLPAAVATGAVGAAALMIVPGRLGVACVGGAVLLIVFAVWPQAALPSAILGGPLAWLFISNGTVAQVVAIQAGILAAAIGGLLLRWWLDPMAPRRLRLRADAPMACLTALAVAGGLLGVVLGSEPDRAVVVAYHVGVIPLYYFLASWTLSTPARLRSAGIIAMVIVATQTWTSMLVPGRHGGLFSCLALAPVLFMAGRFNGWKRAAWALMSAGLIADIVLASYRGVWLAAAMTLTALLLFGGRSYRRGLLVAVALVGVGAAFVVGASAFTARWDSVSGFAADSAGYREAESMVGLTAFVDSPILGAGLGHTLPDVYIPEMGVITIGPIYHSFFVTLLSNAGLIGLGLLLWGIARALRVGFAQRDGLAFAFAATLPGFLGFAMFAAPTDGHWELGLLPALALIAARLHPAGPVGERTA